MCGKHNVRASAGDNTGQNANDTHPLTGHKLKFLAPLGIEPGPPGWKERILPTTLTTDNRLRSNHIIITSICNRVIQADCYAYV